VEQQTQSGHDPHSQLPQDISPPPPPPAHVQIPTIAAPTKMQAMMITKKTDQKKIRVAHKARTIKWIQIES
jgi:hypothetical protein